MEIRVSTMSRGSLGHRISRHSLIFFKSKCTCMEGIYPATSTPCICKWKTIKVRGLQGETSFSWSLYLILKKAWSGQAPPLLPWGDPGSRYVPREDVEQWKMDHRRLPTSCYDWEASLQGNKNSNVFLGFVPTFFFFLPKENTAVNV